jgi:hypothetical protein
MSSLGDRELVEVWERGQRLSPVDRALAILVRAEGELGIDDLARLSIGQRDTRLLKLRASTFGPRLMGLADCPDCSERLDVAFGTSELLGDDSGAPEISVTEGEYYARVRPPNSLDLGEALRADAAGDPSSRLLTLCILEARHRGEPVAAASLPAEVAEAIERRIAEADPGAEIRLALECPHCGHRWQTTFDIVSFFWSEIHARAVRILQEVDRIASAYGWSEAEILALGAWRRHAYLEILGR